MGKTILTLAEIDKAIRDELDGYDGPASWSVMRDSWFPISEDKAARIVMKTDDENNPYSEIEFGPNDGGEVEKAKPTESGDEKPVSKDDDQLEAKKKAEADAVVAEAAEKRASEYGQEATNEDKAANVADALDVSGGQTGGTTAATQNAG